MSDTNPSDFVQAHGVERLAYTYKEAARAIAVSERTIRRSIQAGKLRVVRVGARVLIPADALRQFAGVQQ